MLATLFIFPDFLLYSQFLSLFISCNAEQFHLLKHGFVHSEQLLMTANIYFCLTVTSKYLW